MAKRKCGSLVGTERLMEDVRELENSKRALQRVKANKGSPGVDGMTVVPLRPGFQICASPPAFRSLSGDLRSITPTSPGKTSTSCSGRFFCRCPLMSRAPYLPFLYSPCGVSSSFRSPFPARPIRCSTFRLGVPHEPCRQQDLLCPWLTSATRSR